MFSFIFYVFSEMKSKIKLIDFKIFLIPEYRYASLIYFFTIGLSIYQIFFLLPLYYENLKMLTTLQTGFHMLAFAVFIGLTSPIAGILSDKIGEKNVLAVNAILYIVTSLLLIPQLNYYTPSVRTIILTIPLGFALGTFFAPVTTLAMRNLGDKTSLGVSLMHYLRFMGGSFGTAIATNTLQKRIFYHYDEISAIQDTSYLQLYLTKIQLAMSNFMSAETAEIKSKILLSKVQQLMATSHAFQDVFRHAGYYGMFGLSFLTFVFLKDCKKNNSKNK